MCLCMDDKEVWDEPRGVWGSRVPPVAAFWCGGSQSAVVVFFLKGPLETCVSTQRKTKSQKKIFIRAVKM